MNDDINERDPGPPRDTEGSSGGGKRLRGPWRWALGAVSIAAVGAGIFFISKKGAVRRADPEPPAEDVEPHE